MDEDQLGDEDDIKDEELEPATDGKQNLASQSTRTSTTGKTSTRDDMAMDYAEEEPIRDEDPSSYPQAPSTNANLNDDDAKCYSSRYQDIDALLDPKAHYTTTGIQQGRLGTCARRLTDYEVQRYIDNNPELQRMYGKTGPSAYQQARDHWQTTGFKNLVFVNSVVDKDNTPFKCASTPNESCMCPGMLWYGPSVRPDNGQKIETFEELREWRTVSSESDDWQSCSAVEFGSDPMPGAEKQCYCEVKPSYEPSRCADEGDDCICNGHVYFGAKMSEDHATLNTFMDVYSGAYTVIDANNTGTVPCTSESFDGADPAAEVSK